MGCELPKVNKFLCCFDLETGGIIIGWLAAIFSAIGVLALSSILILMVIAFDQEPNKDKEGLLAAFIVASVVYALITLYLCFVFYAAIQLIRGTRNRNHHQIRLYMILMGVGVVMSFLQILTAAAAGIGGAIVSAIISAYFFICIYSLYEPEGIRSASTKPQDQTATSNVNGADLDMTILDVLFESSTSFIAYQKAMHIVTIDNFLVCCTLEAGGYVIGYLGAIFSMLGIISLVGLLVIFAVSFDDIIKELTVQVDPGSEWILDALNISKIFVIVIVVCVTLYLLFCFYAFVSLVVGTKSRNHERLVPFLVICAIGIVLNFSLLITPTLVNVINLVISTIIDLYIYICIYSLHVKFRSEKSYKFPESA